MRTVDSLITRALNVTSSDTNTLPATKGVFVSVSGDLAVEMQDGSTVVFPSITSGVFHPISVRRVKSTGTTATGIIAGY